MSILFGESHVEQDLGFMQALYEAGKGGGDEPLLEDLVILKLCGPQTAEEAGGICRATGRAMAPTCRFIGSEKGKDSGAFFQPAAKS